MSKLGDVMRSVDLPTDATARDRAIAAAVRATSRQPKPNRQIALTRTQIAVAIAASALVFAFTPPGRDTVSWAADLIGIGDVGGPPTSEERPTGVRPASDQIVIANGETPGGTHYEIVAYRTDEPVAGEADMGATCVFVDFSNRPSSSGGTCGDDMFVDGGALFLAGVSDPSREQDAAFAQGYVKPGVARVIVGVAGSESSPEDAQLAFVDGELQDRLGADQPVGFFLAFLPRDFGVHQLRSGERHLEVTAYGPDGSVIQRTSLPTFPPG